MENIGELILVNFKRDYLMDDVWILCFRKENDGYKELV